MFRSPRISHILQKSPVTRFTPLFLSFIFIALFIATSFDKRASAQQKQLPGNWFPARTSPRYSYQNYTRLLNGNVIAVGASCACPTSVWRNAEIFNPVTGLWRDTAPMNFGRNDYST